MTSTAAWIFTAEFKTSVSGSLKGSLNVYNVLIVFSKLAFFFQWSRRTSKPTSMNEQISTVYKAFENFSKNSSVADLSLFTKHSKT